MATGSKSGRGAPAGVKALAASGFQWSFSRFQTLVWALTFFSYTLYHASRKPLSIVKGVLHPVPVPSINSTQPPAAGWSPFNGPTGRTLLGELDFAFLACYSFGMYFAGQLADRQNLRTFLAAGMFGSGLFCCLFGMGYFWNIHSLPFYLAAHMLTGLFQATGWPSVVAVMANWHGKEGRGLIMGVWNAHTSLGNILGSLIASAVLGFGWGWGFLVPGLSIAGGGLLIYLLMPAEPQDVGFESPHPQQEQHEEPFDAEGHPQGIPKSERTSPGSLSEWSEGDMHEPLLPASSSVSSQEGELPLSEASSLEASGTLVGRATVEGENQNGEQVHGVHYGEKMEMGSPQLEAGTPQIETMVPVGCLGAGAAEGGEEKGKRREGVEEKCERHEGTGLLAAVEQSHVQAVGFFQAWGIPGVAAYAFCLFFAKLVAYTFLNWLPFYISHTKIDGVYLSDALAGVTSTVFDLGGVVGGILAGHLSDRYNAQALVSAVFLIGAVPALGTYYAIGHLSLWLNVALLAVVGFFVNAPYALITCAVSADLGQHSSLKGNARALATVTGIIDGTGSLGAGLGPLLTGVVADFLGGWVGVFGMLMCSSALSVLCIFNLARHEWRAYRAV